MGVRGQTSVKATIMLLTILISAGLLSCSLHDGAEEAVSDSLHAVTVTADKGVVVSRTDTLRSDNSSTISEILQQSTGLHIGDNGGMSGLKSISLRGMGSAHTAIYIDGVRVGNVQSGQNDIGMMGPEMFNSVVIDYAQNSVSFNTERPSFTDGVMAGKAALHAGSFCTWLPSLSMDFKVSDKISISADAALVSSEGNFRYGDGLVRANNDISQARGAIDLFGDMDRGTYHLKAFVNAAERGTPGPVSWPSEDRQKDLNTFLQGSVKMSFSPLYTLRLSAKGGYDDISYSSAWGDSRYGQTELQLNSAHDFQINSRWKMSLAADLQWDGLQSGSYNASRTTVFSAIASSFRTRRFSANVALEYNGAYDRNGRNRNAFCPSADIRYTLADGLDITAFGRRAYRVPTFNELYYAGYGNPELEPEDAVMTAFGIDYNVSSGAGWHGKVKADGFLNILTDKITSAPTAEDPSIWLPYNIGKVRSVGTDIMAGISYDAGEWIFSLDARYTFQSAVDRTEGSYTYDCQIPYIAKHTASIIGSAYWKGWMLRPIWHLRADRHDGTGEMPDWHTLDIILSKVFNIKRMGEFRINLSLKNIYDNRYEIVGGYPMPGRNMTAGIELKF